MAIMFDENGQPVSAYNAQPKRKAPTYTLKAEGERIAGSLADAIAHSEQEADYLKAVCHLRNAADELYWQFQHGQLKAGSTRAFIERARNKLYVLELNAKALEPTE